MKSIIPRVACAAALLLCSVSVVAISTPAAAQGDFQIGFDAFHDQLSNYGDWVYSDRWGEVWVPGNVPDDFRPYDTNGYWAYTDEYGWYWASNYEWGDIPFHYGRWVNDPDDGWLWIPGYVWSPAWVIWRNNGQYTGWMAMPPDDTFLGVNDAGIGFSRGGVGISIDFNDMSGEYGYSRWYGRSYGRDRFAANWVFVPTGHIADRDYHRYEAPRASYATIINNTRNITNYTVVNNYVVNRGVDFHAVQRAGGRPVVAMHASVVIHNPQFVVRADMGRQIQMRVRHDNPHGNGFANSAPQPSATVVQSLSTNVNARRGNGHAPAHLFTRTTVQNAPLKPAANGPGGSANPHGNGMQGNGIGGTTNGPTGMPNDHRHDNNGAMTGGTDANGAQSNGNNGPNHHPETNGAMGGNTATPPNNAAGGTTNGPTGDTRRHENTNKAGTTGGAVGGSSSTPPNNASGGGMNGSMGETRHHETTTTGGTTGGAMGGGSSSAPPNNASGGMNGSTGETHHHETTTTGGTTGGAAGGSSSTTPSSTSGGSMNGSTGETRHRETTTTSGNTSTPPANPPSNPPPRHQDKLSASPTTGSTPPSSANGDPHENSRRDNQAGGSQAGGDKDKNKDKDKKDENAPPP